MAEFHDCMHHDNNHDDFGCEVRGCSCTYSRGDILEMQCMKWRDLRTMGYMK